VSASTITEAFSLIQGNASTFRARHRVDSPITSQPKPKKSPNVRKQPPHDLSHQSVPSLSNSPLPDELTASRFGESALT
jgi:hypothetical protein